MKRKADRKVGDGPAAKRKAKPSISFDEAKKRFRDDLFDKDVLDGYISQYAQSSPYKHCVINGLINDQLLRDVRTEIISNIAFTPKETDIYKIYQSGDLANLDGLEDQSLSKLPSLHKLRDALYSQSFRDYISSITGSGPLSGQKKDLAINIYKPGGYLICHDDVIGTRKVSYILYLVDPDLPWKPEWGGALRLFPVRELKGKDGMVARTPAADHCKTIPPAWNQLSFFEVQPNESFHDVEEVYRAENKDKLEKDGGRVRVAISGWFHIPQSGEYGFVQGAAEELEKNSGLAQLQGNPDQYDMPLPNIVSAEPQDNPDEFTAEDLDFLIQYMSPQWLTPDAVEGIRARFEDASSIVLPDFLHPKIAEKLKNYIVEEEAKPLSQASDEIEKGAWKVAKPPHKHRFMFLQTGKVGHNQGLVDKSPVTEIMDKLLPSPQFHKWLNMITECTVLSSDIMARRFRRGMDYTLATGYEGNPRLEMNIGFTPTGGWKDDNIANDEDEVAQEESVEDMEKATSGAKNGTLDSSKTANNNKRRDHEEGKEDVDSNEYEEHNDDEDDEDDDVGGHEIYMAVDDDGEDAAVYKAADEEDSVLFRQAAAFNRFTLVLRDSDILRFVKYVSRSAQGDRWDLSATFEVKIGEGEDGVAEDKSDEEFQGFSDREEDSSN